MPAVTIATWNSQGNPTRNMNTTGVLNGLIVANQVVLLQECGGFVNLGGHGGYTIIGSEQAGHYNNNRCSVGIAYAAGAGVAASGMNFNMPSGRPMVWIRIDNAGSTVFIGAVHCESSGNAGQDRSRAASELLALANGNPIILGGDFNCTPNGGTLRIGSTLRGIDYTYVTTGNATQALGNNIDYFLRTNGAAVGVAPARSWNPLAGGPHPSDHTPVFATFNY